MMSRRDVVRRRGVGRRRGRKKHLDYIEFSAEDASRSDPDYLVEVFAAVIEAGARVINVPDTTGYFMPEEYGSPLPPATGARARRGARDLERALPQRSRHGDGQLAGRGRERRAPGRVHGERYRRARRQHRDGRGGDGASRRAPSVFGVDTGIVTEEIFATSRLVSQITGLAVQVNKAIVGENAFAHEAGIHQDGVLKYRQNYEIMNPESIGLASNRLVLGKHSGPSRARGAHPRARARHHRRRHEPALRRLQGARRRQEDGLRRGPDRARGAGVGARRERPRSLRAGLPERHLVERRRPVRHREAAHRRPGGQRHRDRRRHGGRLLQGDQRAHRPASRASIATPSRRSPAARTRRAR